MIADLTTHKRLAAWFLLAFYLSALIQMAECNDNSAYNGGGNYNKFYSSQNSAYENYQNSYNAANNKNNDDAIYADDDDATNNYYGADDDVSNNYYANDDGKKNYDYAAVDYDDKYDKQWQDDLIQVNLDNFDDISIHPVSCVNYNNGHFIKFEMYDSANSFQCHFGKVGTFVVSISHYMRAYFNYQALTHGNSFSLPNDVGYLNCIPLKLENYGIEYTYDDDKEEDEEDAENEEAILYAKVGCKYKETSTSRAFQLHVYTDKKCTQPYDDGQTQQQHARSGYQINLDKYYTANLDDDGQTKYTDYPVNTLNFKTKVSFRPSFYRCHSCKPNLSETFNKFTGTFYDDEFIGKNGMTRSQYGEYAQEEQANKQDYQYDATDDYTVQDVDDAYYASMDDDISITFVDDYNNHNYYDDNNNRRQLRKDKKQAFFAPAETEFKKYELEFWNDMNNALSHRDRSLYEDSYGGVDDWNMCQQVHKYGMYCDEDCQSLDAFSSNEWSSADLILLGIMCSFMATMMILVVAKHKRATMKLQKQQSFYSENNYSTSADANQVPGLPPTAMYSIFGAIILIIAFMALINFVNETLVFAVVCCILFFIYMLKITLFSVNKRPLLLASPNHEDVFGYNNADFDVKKGGYFS